MIAMFKIRLGTAPGMKKVAGIRVNDLFNNLDGDHSRSIGRIELLKYLKLQKVDLSASQVDDIFATFGTMEKLNEDGEIPYTSFVEVLTGRLTG